MSRLFGLSMMATLLAGGVAAQDMPLPDPDGLDLPESSILDPGYSGSHSLDSSELLPAPHAMSGPVHEHEVYQHQMDGMGPSSLVNDPQNMSGPYPQGAPYDGFAPDGDPWGHYGPEHGPYMGWDGEPAVPESSGTWLNRGVWFAEADAVALNRVWNRSDVLLAAQDQNVEDPFFNDPPLRGRLQTNRVLLLSDSNPGNDVGVRTTLGRFLFRDDHNRDHSAEFTLFGAGDFVSDLAISSSGTGANSLFTPYPIAGSQNRDFDQSTFQRFIYTSRFNSFELNYHMKRRLGRDQMIMDPNGCWRRVANNGFKRDFLAGLRFIELIEHVDWQAENIVTTGVDGRYIVNVRNSLFGVQLGEGISYETGRWSIGANAKVGLFANDADSRSQLFFTDGVNNFDRFSTEDELSFMAEVHTTGRWHMTPNFSLRAGLDLFFIESVALAPHQLNFLPVYNQITTSGDPVYMGGSLGFECYW